MVEVFGSTVDCDRDSAVEISGDDADHSGDESDSSSDSWESAADSGPESTNVDCLACLTPRRWPSISTARSSRRKYRPSCSIAKVCLLLEAQLKWIGGSSHAV